MATRKTAKKATKTSAKKATRKLLTPRLTGNQIIAAILRRREWVMYGIPIQDLIATGNLADMRRVSQAARTHMVEVQRSIAKLDAAISTKAKR